jgi:hypothetical protein
LLKYGKPGVGAQQKVHPHRNHKKKEQKGLMTVCFSQYISQRVAQYKANDGTDYGKPYGAHKHRNKHPLKEGLARE